MSKLIAFIFCIYIFVGCTSIDDPFLGKGFGINLAWVTIINIILLVLILIILSVIDSKLAKIVNYLESQTNTKKPETKQEDDDTGRFI